MTSSLPSPAKSPPAEGARLDLGNFFQSPARPGATSSKPDFESLLPKRQPDKQTDEAHEEREAAKARKKTVDAALATPPLQTSPAPRPEIPEPATTSKDSHDPETPPADPHAAPPTQGKPLDKSPRALQAENELEETAPADPDSPESTEFVGEPAVPDEKSATKSSSPRSKEPAQEALLAKESRRETRADLEASKSNANGMEPAPPDPEMISLATFDGVESGSAALREPSITTIHRLTAFAATADRNSLAPAAGSGGSPDAGLGQLATGPGATPEARPSSPSSPAAQASALLKSFGPELEKFRQTGRSQIQLDLPVGNNETVRIRLSLRAGELRSTFITESPELREALQKAWPEFAQSTRDRGFRLGDPNFQQSFQGNDTAFGQNTRRESSFAPSENSAAAPAPRKTAPTRPTSAQPSTALWA
jgi:hypothetical protein